MANVKITDLTALSGGDAVDADVFVVVDISADQTKKITKTELQTAIAAGGSGFNANDFVTFTQLNSNINVVSANTVAVEARRTQNIAGAISTVVTSDLTAARALVTNGSGKIAISDITTTEINFLDGVSSALQTQLDAKIATTTSASNDFVTFTRLDANINVTTANVAAVETRRTQNIAGAISSVTTGNLAASRALASDGSGKIVVSDVTSTELAFLDGVSSAVQTQITALESRRAANLVSATFTDDVAVSGNLLVTLGTGVGDNTVPATKTVSWGNPANVIIRAVAAKSGNVIVGDPTGTTSHSLDIRGTANTGALTAAGLSYPTTDGSDGQVIQTDGSGALTFVSVSSGDRDPAVTLASDLDCGTASSQSDGVDAFGQSLDDAYFTLDLLDQAPNSLGTVDQGALS